MKQIVLRYLEKWVESITGAVIVFIAMYILLWPVKLEGMGMEKTINDNDWVFSSRFASMMSKPERGDLVMFMAKDAHKPLVKRVIAVSGDKVVIQEGNVYVNDEVLEGDYLIGTAKGNLKTVVEEGEFFALSDNRGVVEDSRIYGKIPIQNVKAKILFRVYPFEKITVFF